MRKFITLLTGIACLLFFTAVTVNGQAWVPVGGIHIYNPNNAGGGFVGIGTNAAPGTLLDVYRNMQEPTIRVRNLGGIGGATFQMSDQASGGDWKFKVIGGGHFKVRDQATGLDPLFIERNAANNCIYVKAGGNVGMGTNNPLEKLHVNGAILIGNTANINAGTIRWDGANFWGHNGAGWVALDAQPTPNPWILAPNIPIGNPEFFSPAQPMSLSFAFPGVPNSLARLYVTDMTAPPIFPHQIAIETMTGGAGVLNASQLFRVSFGMAPPFTDYSMGIFGADNTFKVCYAPALLASAQSDATTMIRAFPSGIIDMSNQSRVRAYQFSAAGLVQTVPPSVWTPVNFNFETPLPIGWDEQSEFILAPAPNTPTPLENSFFTATQEGYYQVNARCQFELPTGPGPLVAGSYVSIAIWTGPAPGGTASYAIGNNLAIGYLNAGQYYPLTNNSAPNVSDVVYLLPGQIISIRVWQSTLIPLNLMQGSNACYVSIHKVS